MFWVRMLMLSLLITTVALSQTQPAQEEAVATTKPADAWTPEGIARDPAGYLKWIDGEMQTALAKLKAARIEAAQSIAMLQTMQTESDNAITVGEKALRELAGVYQAAEAANSWPAKWNGRAFSKEAVQTQIISLHKQVELKRNIKAKAVRATDAIKTRQVILAKPDDEAKQALAEIAANRELLNVQAVNDAMRDKLIALQPRTAAIIATAATGVADAVTLNDLAALAPPEPTFEQILNAYRR